MTRELIVSLAVLLAGSGMATGQQPTAETRIKIVQVKSGPAELRMSGAATGAIGQPLTITVSGLPTVDLGKTVGEQTKWIDSIRFDVSTPDGKPATLDKELSMSVSPWEWRLRLTLTPQAAGVYLAVCDWNEAPFGLALHRVTVGGTAPVPPTNPNPDDPPPPPNPNHKLLRVTYVYEKDQNQCPRPVASALQKLNADGSGVVASEVDDDVVNGKGEVPEQYRVAFEEAKKVGIPCLVVQWEDMVLRVVKDPKTAEQVAEAVKP